MKLSTIVAGPKNGASAIECLALCSLVFICGEIGAAASMKAATIVKTTGDLSTAGQETDPL